MGGLLVFASLAIGQQYPNKAIRWIVPFAAGGPQDVLTRAIAPELSNLLKVPVIVDNRAGAGGSVAMIELARAAPDGYTIAIAHVGTHAINPHLLPDTAFNPFKDHVFVAPIYSYTMVLLINPGLPVKNGADLIAYAKANPNNVSFGSGGIGTSTHLAAEALKALSGTPMLHVAYKGSAPALVALLSGEVTYVFNNLSTALPQIRAGKVRALAVSSSARSAFARDIQTLRESGVPGFDKIFPELWGGLFAPAGLPKPIVDRLSTEMGKSLNNKAVVEKLEGLAIDVWRFPREEFPAFLRGEYEKWGKLVKSSGAK